MVLIPRRALARRAGGGPRALGRAARSVAGYAELGRELLERAGYRCECCRRDDRGLEREHATPAGRGGADDPDTVWICCRPCHRWKEAPYARGRLVVVPLGGGRFRWEEWRGVDKWHATLIRIVRDGSL